MDDSGPEPGNPGNVFGDGLIMSAAENDAMARAIEAFAVAERRRNFQFLARNDHRYMNGEDLSVYLATPDRIIHGIQRWHVDPTDLVGCTWYTFRQHIHDLEDTVPLRRRALTNAGAAINVGSIEVLDIALDMYNTQTWVPLCAWMREKFKWDHAADWTGHGPKLQLENQVIWWRNNNSHFRMMDLPRELREAVYLEVIGAVVLPEVTGTRAYTKVTFGRGMKYGSHDRPGRNLDPDIDPPNLKLLLVNRQVHREAVSAVWTLATKRFHSTTNLIDFNICTIRNVAPPTALNRIQLELSAACYFQLIGIRPTRDSPFKEFIPGTNAVSIARLKTIKTIRSLDFRFMSSKYEDAVCPWDALKRSKNTPNKHSCQKIWIDWFFTFALEYLRGWDIEITMSGCIKQSTRTKWQKILQLEKAGFHHDTEEMKMAIQLGKQDILPIECTCSIPCYVGEQADEYHKIFANSYLEYRIEGLREEIEENYFSFSD